MSLTLSTMLPLGTISPDFTLPDTVSGKNLSLKELKSECATLIMFICNHCPYVLHVNPEIIRIANEYIPQSVSFIAISSNDVTRYPADAPDKMKQFALEHDFPFSYLYDESQAVAKAFDAACTPDFYLFDSKMKLVYRGRLDQSKPNSNIPLTGEDLRTALNNTLAGKSLHEKQYPSAGCGIKWRQDLMEIDHF